MTINKSMKYLENGFDGTPSKALETSKLASWKPKWLQDYMLPVLCLNGLRISVIIGLFKTFFRFKSQIKNTQKVMLHT